MKRIAILGSTGSIGQSALSVVDAHPIACRSSAWPPVRTPSSSPQQVARYRPRVAAMASGAAVDRLAGQVPAGVALAGTGRDGLVAVASHPDVDLVLCASAGTDGLEAVLAAIAHGKTVALANKEVLVMAGGARRWRRRAGEQASRSCRSTASTTPSTSACTAGRVRGQAPRADGIRRTFSRPIRV